MVNEFLTNFLNAIKSQQLYIKGVSLWIFLTFLCVIYFIFTNMSVVINSPFELFVLTFMCFGVFFSIGGLLFLLTQLSVISRVFDILIKNSGNNIESEKVVYKSSKDDKVIKLKQQIEISSDQDIENLIQWAISEEEYEFADFLKNELEKRRNKND